MVTVAGSGFSRYGERNITRWREDPVTDPWGSCLYIRDVAREHVWSPSFYPCRVVPEQQHIRFTPEQASFTRVDGDMRTGLDICVAPDSDAEIRRLSLTNTGGETRVIEVTTFQELSLANPVADDAHPAFSKLFVRTEYAEDTECLIAGRRPRESREERIWAAHTLVVEGHSSAQAEFETARAAFIGRGHTLAEPRGLRSPLRGTVGSVADPAFVMRRRVRIGPGQTVRFLAITAASGSKEEAVAAIRRLRESHVAERMFQLAWRLSQIEFRHLHMSASDAALFQRLAGQVLYTPPLQATRKEHICKNVKGQSGLWAYGISGDRPIVVVTVADKTHVPFVARLLKGHEYLRRKGLEFDLVLMNESAGGYRQDLEDTLQHAAEHGVDRNGAALSGVHIVKADQLTEEDRTLLLGAARIVLQAGGPSLGAQLRVPKNGDLLPEDMVPTVKPGRFDSPVEQENPSTWLFYNGWGGFSPDGTEYRISVRQGHHLPAPWINVMANPRFGTFVSELGTGYTWWKNSRECKLTPWSNDPVLDPPGELCYLRDEESGEVWLATPSAAMSGQPYKVTHGRGFTRFSHVHNGIGHDMTVFVPLRDPVKMVKLELRNKSAERRRLSVTRYAEWVMGVRREGNSPFIVTDWDETAGMMVARNLFQEAFRDAHGFLAVCSNRPVDDMSWTGDREEFIGRNGRPEQPAALERRRLSCRTGIFHDACGAVQAKIHLEPGEERTIYMLLGCESSREAAAELVDKYRDPSACEQSWTEMRRYWEKTLGQIRVSTPSKEMDVLLNGWLLYQTLACRMWARTAFYQAGGAYGFRDQLQDSLALLHTSPELTRRQILLHASHQYEEGDVQHWWHEETGRGIRTLFSDDLLWLPYAVCRYIEHTGDTDILDESAPYLFSEPLQEGEEFERYEPTVPSGKEGSIYEHCCRAIDRSLERIGERGLPLIGVGDWNDGMNFVGQEGRGESVWLGWFLCEVLRRFEAICERRDDRERADRYLHASRKLTASLDKHAWDGNWYRRAVTDAGTWLGSVQNGECRIDAIAQSWSVISGAGSPDRITKAMDSFDRELVDHDIPAARLLAPPFDKTDPSPGYIQGYPPGIRENGAQYTHGVIWSIVAWSMLGEGEKAFELFHLMNPVTHTLTPQEVRRYTGEPYVMAADVYTEEPNIGHAGWTWYTGAAGWMYQAGIEWILGIRRRENRLILKPCIPCDWPEYSVRYQFGKTRYHIVVRNPEGRMTGADKLVIDGEEVPLDIRESPDGGVVAELVDDGREHRIELKM